MSEAGEWVNLLRTPEAKPTAKLQLSNGQRADPVHHVKVLEHTPRPLKKVGVKKSKRSEVQVLRSQVVSLEEEKRGLALSVGGGGRETRLLVS